MGLVWPRAPGGSPPQESMLEAREKIRSAAKERMDVENAEWKEKLECMKPKIDDNVEDEDIGRERARLREEVEKKRVAEEKGRKAQAAEFFSRVKAAKPLTDDKSKPDGSSRCPAILTCATADSQRFDPVAPSGQ